VDPACIQHIKQHLDAGWCIQETAVQGYLAGSSTPQGMQADVLTSLALHVLTHTGCDTIG
jgi:hypothetical protein